MFRRRTSGVFPMVSRMESYIRGEAAEVFSAEGAVSMARFTRIPVTEWWMGQ
jgi:hypothetical protein